MATIENSGITSEAGFRDEIRSMDDGCLIGQDLVQQGAIHALSHLLMAGCSEQNAADMLAHLRTNSRLVREEADRRGVALMFDEDQTRFS